MRTKFAIYKLFLLLKSIVRKKTKVFNFEINLQKKQMDKVFNIFKAYNNKSEQTFDFKIDCTLLKCENLSLTFY